MQNGHNMLQKKVSPMRTRTPTGGVFEDELLDMFSRHGVNSALFGKPRQPLRPLPRLVEPPSTNIYPSLQTLVEARDALFVIMYQGQRFGAAAERIK